MRSRTARPHPDDSLALRADCPRRNDLRRSGSRAIGKADVAVRANTGETLGLRDIERLDLGRDPSLARLFIFDNIHRNIPFTIKYVQNMGVFSRFPQEKIA